MSLLSVEDLSIRFGRVVSLDGVSFDHEPGQILGLMGLNGSGKRMVFTCITHSAVPEACLGEVDA